MSTNTSDVETLRYLLKNELVHWDVVVEIANAYLIGPAFWSGLIQKNLDQEVDGTAAQYFTELHRLNQVRNRRLRQQMLQVVRALQNANIKTILLKGAGELVQPMYADIGYRIIGDLDILIKEDQYNLAINALAPLGYRSLKVSYDPTKLHHYAPLFRPGDYGVIELHRHAVHLKTLPLLSTIDVWENARATEFDGLKLLLPCPTHAILINLLHSQVADRYHYRRQFNLRSLLDFSAIQICHGNTIDWSSIRHSLRAHHMESVLEAYELSAHRLLNSPRVACHSHGPLARLQHAACQAVVRWPIANSLARRLDDLSKERICHRYKCPEHRLSITAHQLRYLFAYLKKRF